MRKSYHNQRHLQPALRCMLQLLTSVLLSMFAGASQAAESSGNALPYEDWLRTLQQSLTGPVAFSVAMIGIVSCGATLIFAGGEIGRFMRALIYVVLVMTMLIGANSLMSRFFNGASIGSVAEAQEVTATQPTPRVSEPPLQGLGNIVDFSLQQPLMCAEAALRLSESMPVPKLQQQLMQAQLQLYC